LFSIDSECTNYVIGSELFGLSHIDNLKAFKPEANRHAGQFIQFCRDVLIFFRYEQTLYYERIICIYLSRWRTRALMMAREMKPLVRCYCTIFCNENIVWEPNRSCDIRQRFLWVRFGMPPSRFPCCLYSCVCGSG